MKRQNKKNNNKIQAIIGLHQNIPLKFNVLQTAEGNSANGQHKCVPTELPLTRGGKSKLVLTLLLICICIFSAQATTITEFPWFEDFTENLFPPEGWSVVNIGSAPWVRSSFYAVTQPGSGTPDNWLITPQLQLPEDGNLSLSYRIGNMWSAPHYGVFISTVANEIDDFILFFNETLPNNSLSTPVWADRSFSLNEFAGEVIYIAFRIYEPQSFPMLTLDDVLVTAVTGTLYPPQNLTYSASGQTVILNWEPPAGENPLFEGYRVYRGNEQLTTTPITELTFTSTDSPNGTHIFRVRAVYAGALSDAIETEVYIFNGTSGLAYTLIDGGTAYQVARGTAADAMIFIPNTYNGLPVTTIGSFLFASALTSIILPENITTITNGAFNFCANLTSIYLSNNITTIGTNVFASCTALTIYAEAESQPSGWEATWNPNSRPVHWGVSGVPLPATDLTFNIVGDVLTLNWLHPSYFISSFLGYRIFNGDTQLTTIPLMARTIQVTGIASGLHNISVRAIYGNVYESVETTIGIGFHPPTDLTAVFNADSVELSWTAPNNGGSAIIRYEIRHSTNNGSSWST